MSLFAKSVILECSLLLIKRNAQNASIYGKFMMSRLTAVTPVKTSSPSAEDALLKMEISFAINVLEALTYSISLMSFLDIRHAVVKMFSMLPLLTKMTLKQPIVIPVLICSLIATPVMMIKADALNVETDSLRLKMILALLILVVNETNLMVNVLNATETSKMESLLKLKEIPVLLNVKLLGSKKLKYHAD